MPAYRGATLVIILTTVEMAVMKPQNSAVGKLQWRRGGYMITLVSFDINSIKTI